MSTWDELRVILRDLQTDPRRPLQSHPTPSIEDRQPPFRITLKPWATSVAAELLASFGADVDLTVGVLHYPDRELRPPNDILERLRRAAPLPLLPPDEITTELDGQVFVASGHDIRSALIVHNHAELPEAVATNGQLTARVLDPQTGESVGGFSGGQTLPLVRFEIPPGESRTIPLLVGTTSYRPELGYAIPPGDWSLDAVLKLDRGTFRTPPMPLTIVP